MPHAGSVIRWRTRALIEHHGPDHEPADPDLPGPRSGNPVTYEAMRLPNAVYVEYVDGEREYYRIDRDPSERVNLYPGLSPPRRARLHAALRRLARCRGSRGCWAAGGPAVISG